MDIEKRDRVFGCITHTNTRNVYEGTVNRFLFVCVLFHFHIRVFMALSHLAGLGQRTSPYNLSNILSGGEITRPSDLGDGLHT